MNGKCFIKIKFVTKNFRHRFIHICSILCSLSRYRDIYVRFTICAIR